MKRVIYAFLLSGLIIKSAGAADLPPKNITLPSVQATAKEPTNIIAEIKPDLSPLSTKDVERYNRIFALQDKGKWRKADQIIKRLDNKILLGHLLYQRYMHPTAYSSRYKELAAWLNKYSDHPGAKRIYALARKKNGGRTRGLRKPSPLLARAFPADKPVRRPAPEEKAPTPVIEPEKKEVTKTVSEEAKRSKAERREVARLKKQIRRFLFRHKPDRAEKRLWAFERRGLLTGMEFDTLLAKVAHVYFQDNQDAKAHALAHLAADRSRGQVSQADWVAGLSAWRLGDCTQAAEHFEHVAYSSVSGDWTAAAGAYWAARSYITCRQPERVSALLKQAATFHRTFYGLIAARQLGQKPHLNWAAPAFNTYHYNRIHTMPSVQRAIALSQTGKTMLADMELTNSWRRSQNDRHDALLGLASTLGLAGTQLKIGKIEEQKRMTALDSTLYPVPHTEPIGGFNLDKALMFAIMRQESEFNSWARSHVGARGLMQVMPRTASYISRDRSLRFGSRIKLDDPRYNMALGQQYMQSMLGPDFANGNLFKTLTAYNAGPGNLRKWLRKVNFQDDPLLFIESIPARETRNYIEKVISNFWIYRMRMQQSVPSLDRVAAGDWPLYKGLDNIKKSAKGKEEKYAHRQRN